MGAIKKIVIEVNGKDYEFTEDEARSMKLALDELFQATGCYPIRYYGESVTSDHLSIQESLDKLNAESISEIKLS